MERIKKFKQKRKKAKNTQKKKGRVVSKRMGRLLSRKEDRLKRIKNYTALFYFLLGIIFSILMIFTVLGII